MLTIIFPVRHLLFVLGFYMLTALSIKTLLNSMLHSYPLTLFFFFFPFTVTLRKDIRTMLVDSVLCKLQKITF